jgi:hypothetical protein
MYLQLLCHLVGDYFLQSDWMALNKNKRTFPCLVHVILYTLPFLIITTDPDALFWIAFTHFLLDRWSLTKYIIWAKNFMNPTFSYHPFDKCCVTGYYDDWFNDPSEPEVRKKFITTWLYIISDNTIHFILNYWILAQFAKITTHINIQQ